MRSKLLLLTVGLSLALLSAAVIRASSLILEEADLYSYSDPYEVNRGANGDVYVSDAGVGVWRVAASGAYTLYRVFADVLDAQPDAEGDIWYTDGADVVARLNVDDPSPTRTEWVLEGAYGLWGLTFDEAGRVWVTQEAGPNLYRFDPSTTELCTYSLEAWSTYVLHQNGDVWLADWGADQIRRLSASGQVTSWSIPWTGARPLGLAPDGAGGLWWADRGLAALVRLEPGANRMTRYDLPQGTRPQIADVRADQVWYSERTPGETGTVGVLDPAVGTGISVTVVPVSTSVAPECGDLGSGTTTEVPVVEVGTLDWVSDTQGTVLEQDGWTIYELPDGSWPYGLTDGGDTIWMADRARRKLARLEPSTLPAPDIELEKRTNGEDADDPPGPAIQVGETVTWTYVVTNTGDVDLTGVRVVDDNGTPADATDDYVCDIGILPARAVDGTTCLQVGTAAAGPYENRAEVAGTYEELPVTAVDVSHYVGGSVGIDLEKLTNGEDADAAPGPEVAVGSPVIWTYVVSNTGDLDLTGVTVTDDNGTVGDPSDDYECVIGALAARAVDDTTCSQSGTAVEGQYANVAVAEGHMGATSVTDADASHYRGIAQENTIFLPVVLR
jgi:streptogramin lyase